MVNLRFIAGVVDRVIDGDTIRVRLDGARYTVRLTGIDTSETKHPTLGVQPFGPEASAYTTTRLTVLPSSSVGEESLSPNHPDTSSRF